MIVPIGPEPSAQELAAIVAAIALSDTPTIQDLPQPIDPWTFAMRNPDLDFDELRNATRARSA